MVKRNPGRIMETYAGYIIRDDRTYKNGKITSSGIYIYKGKKKFDSTRFGSAALAKDYIDSKLS